LNSNETPILEKTRAKKDWASCRASQFTGQSKLLNRPSHSAKAEEQAAITNGLALA
jgi:hypothetical protein